MSNQRNHTLDCMKRAFEIFPIILQLVRAPGFQGSPAQKKTSK